MSPMTSYSPQNALGSPGDKRLVSMEWNGWRDQLVRRLGEKPPRFQLSWPLQDASQPLSPWRRPSPRHRLKSQRNPHQL